MIYIWPYFAFFSWPLLYRHFILAIVRPPSFHVYPRGRIVSATIAAMLVVVRYNTIVHPFTLADNRHYMFYVFRILLRHPWIKYFAVLIYTVCAWGTLAALGGPPTARQVPQLETTPRKRKLLEEEPFPPSPQLNSNPTKGSKSQESTLPKPNPRKRKLPEEEPFPPSPQLNSSPTKASKSQKSTLPPSPQPAFSPSMTEMLQQDAIPPSPSKMQKMQKMQVAGHRASFILVWLLATALSIITTPLVEPRYLIVPWLVWRLHMANPRPEKDYALAKRPDGVGKSLFEAFKAVLYKRHDHRLWLETMWFLTINLATGYIFLYWGFEWPQEPGKVQRFMW